MKPSIYYMNNFKLTFSSRHTRFSYFLTDSQKNRILTHIPPERLVTSIIFRCVRIFYLSRHTNKIINNMIRLCTQKSKQEAFFAPVRPLKTLFKRGNPLTAIFVTLNRTFPDPIVVDS